MYINANRHILSKSICLAALINLVSEFINAAIRIVFNSANASPDMLNAHVFNINFIIQVLVIVAITLIFYKSLLKMKHILQVVSDDDVDQMAILQKEYNPNSISTLKAQTIYQLLEVWMIIFIFTQFISLASNYQYKNFVGELYNVIPQNSYDNAVIFSNIYNATHGFKYIGMFSAIIIGAFVTAVFLKDRLLKIASGILTLLFILAFLIFQMVTFDAQIKIISIVWTSVIYHGLETIGLILFSIYLAKNYKGI